MEYMIYASDTISSGEAGAGVLTLFAIPILATCCGRLTQHSQLAQHRPVVVVLVAGAPDTRHSTSATQPTATFATSAPIMLHSSQGCH